MAAQVIAIASGKGGTGKSTLSVFLGAAIAAHKKSVLLIELDAGFRSADLLAGISEHAVFDLNDVLTGNCSPTKALEESPLYKGLFVLCAPYSEIAIERERFLSFMTAVRNSVDVVILDVPAGFSNSVSVAMECLTPEDLLLLVCTPDLVCARSIRTFLTTMQFKNNIEQRLVFNKVTYPIGGGLKHLDEAIDIIGAQLLGVVPYEQSFNDCIAGTPLLACKGKTAIKNIAKRLQGKYVPLVVR